MSEKKKLVVDDNGIRFATCGSEQDGITLQSLISATQETTKDVILATRFLQDETLRYAGLQVKVAKEGKEEEKNKDVEKGTKSLNEKVESLDSLVEQLAALVKKIDEKVKEEAKHLTSKDLKDSDKAKEEADHASKGADEALGEADEALLKDFKGKAEKKKAELSDTDKTDIKNVVDKSTKISDKESTKTKINLASSKEEAKKILEDAGETTASAPEPSKEDSIMTKEERIARLKARVASIKSGNSVRTADMTKKAEPSFMFEEKTVKKDYGRNQSKDVSDAKRLFGEADKTVGENTKMDKRWLNITASRMADSRVAKYRKACEIAGEAQFKNIKADPMKAAMVKNLVEFGIKEAEAQTLVDNAYIDSKQESVEQLLTAADELVALDNGKFVEAKVKISRYSPVETKTAATVAAVETKKEDVVKTASIQTVVSGQDQPESKTDYKRFFNPERPVGAI